MQHLRVVCRFGFALAIVLSGVGAAFAQPSPGSEPKPAVLNVKGPAACVDAAGIERQVRERSRSIEFVPAGAVVPVLNVRVERPAARSVEVELTVSWPDKRRSRRKLAADGCDEATSAIAFLIALTLDPAAFQQPAASAEVAETAADKSRPATPFLGPLDEAKAGRAAGSASPSDEAAHAAASGTTRSAPADAAAHAAAPGDEADAPAALASTAAAESTPSPIRPAEGAWLSFAFEQLGVDIGAQLTSGVAPRVMPGLSAGIRVAFRGRGFLTPALQLRAAHVWVSDLAQMGGVAAFQLTTLRLDLCPLGVRAGALVARACVTSAVGSLNARGTSTYVPRTSARGWLDLGTSLLASFDLGPVFQVLGGIALVAPLARDRFAFRPDVFHRVDVLCWEGHLGLGVRFP
jgi:hypothetical protein